MKSFINRLRLAWRTFKEGIDYAAMPINITFPYGLTGEKKCFLGTVRSLHLVQERTERHGLPYYCYEGITDRFYISTQTKVL